MIHQEIHKRAGAPIKSVLAISYLARKHQCVCIYLGGRWMVKPAEFVINFLGSLLCHMVRHNLIRRYRKGGK